MSGQSTSGYAFGHSRAHRRFTRKSRNGASLFRPRGTGAGAASLQQRHPMKVLITGSSGLIGSELVAYFDQAAQSVVGIDNNMRADFFGPEGDTLWNLRRLKETTRHFQAYDVDVRDRQALERVFRDEGPFDLVVHCAAQPSHDLAARRSL